MRRSLAAAAVSVIVVAVGLMVFWLRSDLVIDVLNVGDGDAILLRSESVELLVDTGPDGSVLAGLGESMPLFDGRIEAVMLTHPHSDHVAGLVYVLKKYRVGRVYFTATGKGEVWDEVIRAVTEAGVPMTRVWQGWAFELPRAEVKLIWPPPAVAASATDPNDCSAVATVRPTDGSGAAWALLTGDATPQVEGELLSAGLVPETHLLKVAHHGSRFSTTAEFVRAADPDWSVVSTGNRFANHPAWLILERLRQSGSRIWRTDEDGHVRFWFRGERSAAVTGWRSSWPPLVP